MTPWDQEDKKLVGHKVLNSGRQVDRNHPGSIDQTSAVCRAEKEKAAHHLDPSTGSLKSIFCHLVTKLIPPPTHPLSSNLAWCTFWEALFPLTDFGEIYLVSLGLILDIESVRCEDGDCYAKDAHLQIRLDQTKITLLTPPARKNIPLKSR